MLGAAVYGLMRQQRSKNSVLISSNGVGKLEQGLLNGRLMAARTDPSVKFPLA